MGRFKLRQLLHTNANIEGDAKSTTLQMSVGFSNFLSKSQLFSEHSWYIVSLFIYRTLSVSFTHRKLAFLTFVLCDNT